MNPTPAGPEPHRPHDGGPLAPTAPGNAPLTRTHKLLIGIVATAILVISGIGFAGSYQAVAHLAEQKGFGEFARFFPIGVDAGIVAFLALDLLLTWLRIAFRLIRYGAWSLAAATIAFNAVVSWPDPIGVGMHATIPLLFVVAVEGARHAVGGGSDQFDTGRKPGGFGAAGEGAHVGTGTDEFGDKRAADIAGCARDENCVHAIKDGAVAGKVTAAAGNFPGR